MNSCQKKHLLRKVYSYENKIDDCMEIIDEQNKRIEIFQGLINQLAVTIKASVHDKL